jgi:hypothetical protein
VLTRQEALRQVRAIPTTYGGIRYRSRLEARYAVFFKHLRDMGLDAGDWPVYEFQGFEVDGKPYLADFLLPTQSLIAEVKPALDADPDGVARWIALIEARGKERGILLTDMNIGHSMSFLLIGPDGTGGHWEDDRGTWMVCPGGHHLDAQPYCPPIGCQRCRITDGYWYEDDRIVKAFDLARSYRFGR